jgi:hypothetical protein
MFRQNHAKGKRAGISISASLLLPSSNWDFIFAVTASEARAALHIFVVADDGPHGESMESAGNPTELLLLIS